VVHFCSGVLNLIRRSKKIDPADYMSYMRGAWWNDDARAF